MDTSSQHRVVFVSDEAWARIVNVATDRGYIAYKETDNCRLRGIHVFVRDLLQSTLRDARPDYIREQDATLKLAGYAGEWKKYAPRRKRKIKVTDDTLIDASVQALILGIATKLPNTLLGAPATTEGTRCLSMILEAYGTGWITD